MRKQYMVVVAAGLAMGSACLVGCEQNSRGTTYDRNPDALEAGRSGAGAASGLDAGGMPTRAGASVGADLSESSGVGTAGTGTQDRATGTGTIETGTGATGTPGTGQGTGTGTGTSTGGSTGGSGAGSGSGATGSSGTGSGGSSGGTGTAGSGGGR